MREGTEERQTCEGISETRQQMIGEIERNQARLSEHQKAIANRILRLVTRLERVGGFSL